MTNISKQQLEAVITTMLQTVKNIELYPPAHPSVQAPLEKCCAGLGDILRLKGSVTMGIVEGVLVFGDVPFYSTQPAVKEIQARIEGRNINALEFQDGLESRELYDFFVLLTQDSESLRRLGQFSDALKSKGIEHILAKDAKEVYNRAINAVGEVLQEARLGRIPRVSKARSAVSDLRRMVLNDRPAILALTLIKSYDNYLFNHSVNVSVLALALAHGLGTPEDDLSEIGLAGLLHDIGKTLTPKSITLKPGNLSDEEWTIMREHPNKSAEIVSQMEGVSDLVARMVKEHHVHFDQRGYPTLEPGEHPHPYSRIITVADTYDAITTLRPYQKPFQPREAMKIMERLSGRVIDPKYFEEFIKVLGIYPVGTLVRLDTNEIAVVAETRAEAPLLPRIRIVFDPEGKPLAQPRELDLSKHAGPSGEPMTIVSTVDPLLYNVDPSNLL